MADEIIKIQELPETNTIGDSDVLPIVQGGVTYKIPVSVMRNDVAENTVENVEYVDGTLTVTKDGTETDLFNAEELKTDLDLKKSDVGLGNVDNTSDLTKPISTATQAALNTKQNVLTFDDAPVSGSSNPVKSSGIYTALAGKKNTQTAKTSPSAAGDSLSFIDTISQDTQGVITATKKNVTVDSVPTEGSNNPVKSGGVYSAVSDLNQALTEISGPTRNLAEVVKGLGIGSDGAIFQSSSYEIGIARVEPNTVYSVQCSDTSLVYAFFDEYPVSGSAALDGRHVASINTKTITTSASAVYLAVRGNINTNIQIEKGQIATEYIPHLTADDSIARSHINFTVKSLIEENEKNIANNVIKNTINLYDGSVYSVGQLQEDGTIDVSVTAYKTAKIFLKAGTYQLFVYPDNGTDIYRGRYVIGTYTDGVKSFWYNGTPGTAVSLTLENDSDVYISITAEAISYLTIIRGDTPETHFIPYVPDYSYNDFTRTFIDNNTTKIPLEIGTIQMNGNREWTYRDDKHRVRTSAPIRLEHGDVIGLTNYDGYDYYVAVLNDFGGYMDGQYGWMQKDYIVPCSGNYVIVIRKNPEVIIDTWQELGSLLFIKKNGGAYYKLSTGFANGMAHRGYAPSGYAPENSIISFKLAKMFGFDWVETDVAFTADDIPVLLHDRSINRVARNSDGTEISETINIDSITYAEALTYDFGISAQAGYAGTKICSYADFLDLCGKIGMHAFIELKDNDGIEASQENILNVVDMAKKAGLLDKVYFTSYNLNYLNWIKAYDPNVSLGLYVNSITDSVVTSAQSLKSSSNNVVIGSQTYTDAEVEKCAAANIELCVGPLNNLATLLDVPAYAKYVMSDVYNAGYEKFYSDMSS